jgi:hypothetical protein
LAPVLSAQFITAATGRPTAMENLLPEVPPLPRFDILATCAGTDAERWNRETSCGGCKETAALTYLCTETPPHTEKGPHVALAAGLSCCNEAWNLQRAKPMSSELRL